MSTPIHEAAVRSRNLHSNGSMLAARTAACRRVSHSVPARKDFDDFSPSHRTGNHSGGLIPQCNVTLLTITLTLALALALTEILALTLTLILTQTLILTVQLPQQQRLPGTAAEGW